MSKGLKISPGDKFPFHPDEQSSGLEKARTWCRENGFSYGPLCRDGRIGIRRGEFDIAKWKNLDGTDIDLLDGYIWHDGNGWEKGLVMVVIFDTPISPALDFVLHVETLIGQ